MNILVIDNFDSFIYNFVDSMQKLGHQIVVVRNSISMESVQRLMLEHQIEGIVISPGPGKPRQAGVCLDLIKSLAGQLPILGICLGHQAIAQAFDVDVVKAEVPVHGKRSTLKLSKHNIFKGFENGLHVGRYHSLIASGLPKGFELLASCDHEVQAMIHSSKGLIGLQFHPESVLTINGDRLIKNVLEEMAIMAQTLSKNTDNDNSLNSTYPSPIDATLEASV
jgi:anthranilate synthase component II